MAKHTISQSVLKELICYDPETGIFTWAKSRIGCHKGNVAGTIDKSRCVRIGLNHMRFKAHRLAYIYMTGKSPDVIDHHNGDNSDNRWENLSASTHTWNMRNRKIPSNNTSGHMGVRFVEKHNRWSAEIWVGKNINLGRYATKSEAIAARKAAEKIFRFHDNHGRHK